MNDSAMILNELTEAWLCVLRSYFGHSTGSIKELQTELELQSSKSDRLMADADVLVLSSGSATGKTHFGRILRDRGYKPLSRHKDRGVRVDEVDGVDGHFVSRQTFDKLIQQGELVGLTGSYGDRRGYHLPEILKTLNLGRCVSSDGYSFVRLARSTDELSRYRIGSIYLLPPDLPTLVDRIISRAVDRFVPGPNKTLPDHLNDQKIRPRLLEGPRYLQEALSTFGQTKTLIDRFVIYDEPERVMRLLGINRP